MATTCALLFASAPLICWLLRTTPRLCYGIHCIIEDIRPVPRGEYMEKMRTKVAARFSERVQAGSAPAIVHVGPHELDGRSDKLLYDATMEWSPRVVFVEANPLVAKSLEHRLSGFGDTYRNAHVLNAAVCPIDTGNLSFYVVSERLYDDFPILSHGRYFISEWSSLDRSQLLSTFTRFIPWIQLVGPSGAAAYVDEVPARCLTPAGLLQECSLGSGHVDVLVTDAEGYDTTLVSLFMMDRGFRPAYLQFEWDLEYNSDHAAFVERVVPLWRTLASRGYEVRQCEMDICAWLT